MRGTPIESTFCTGREAFCTSELRKLSNDPAITKHPDPNFHFTFHDPDELGDEEPVQLVANFIAPPRRAYATDGLLRRSPKE